MQREKTQPDFVSVPAASDALGVPLGWLRREIEAGRLPTLRAGRRVLMDLAATRAALTRRAAGSEVRDEK